MTLRQIFVALGFKMDESSMNEVEGKIKSIKGFATKALGAIGIGFSIVQMNALAEEFNGINDQIRNATSGLGDQKAIQDKIMKAANDTKMSYADTAKVVGDLVQENKELFGNVDEAIAFNDAVTKTFKAAGKSNEEISGLMEAINKSFAKGKVDTETLNQLMERSPEAVAYLNEQLGSTTDQLEQMVTEGKISLTDLRDAFVNHADDINQKFGNLDYSISDALLNIRNRWGFWLDDLNSSIGLTQSLAKFATRAFDKIMAGLNKARDLAVKVIDKFGGIDKLLRFLAIAAGALFIAFGAGKILGFLKKFTSLLNVANLKILAIIAVVIAIALLVEDFINFMQGNNSVIGDALKKMGYDVDEVRDRIISAWNKVKGFLTQVWLAISHAAEVVVSKLKEFWENNGEEISERLKAIWNGLKIILKAVWDAISFIAVTVFEALKSFWEKWGENIKAAFKAIWDAIADNFMGFIQVIQGVIDFIAGFFTQDWEKAWTGIQEIFDGIWLGIKSFFIGVWNVIYAFFGDKIDAITKKVTGFVDSIKEKLQMVKDFFGGIADGAEAFFDGVGDFFSGDTTVKNTTVANATGGGNKTNNVNQDVKIENTFYGTDQETMSKSAGKAADDTTAQLAKGLAYGT